MCRFTRELPFCALPLSICLFVTLLSCQLLYPQVTNLSNLCTAVYNSGITESLAGNCSVTLGGFFPQSQSHVREGNICYSFYRIASKVFVSGDYELQYFRPRLWGALPKKMFSCKDFLWFDIHSCLSVCFPSRLIASITSKFSCDWTALTSMCVAPMPSVLFAPT